MKMTRRSIPPEIAAKVLFLSDRTCCVCRRKGKPIQIHHINGNPTNNDINNLAVLCLDCHNETQISGGFHRKLDAEQVRLYRDDWLNLVARERELKRPIDKVSKEERSLELELATSLAEIYRENNELELLVIHYHNIGNTDLRDKYIEEALKNNPPDGIVTFLRSLQKRRDLIPEEIIEREINRMSKNKDWSQLARLYVDIGDYKKAAENYIKGVIEDLREGNLFSAAYYLKELAEEGLTEALFEMALRESTAKGDLWWQVRALQELGWESELKDLLIEKKEKIEKSGNISLQELLAMAEGKREAYIQLRKLEAKRVHSGVFGEDPFENSANEGNDNSER